LLTRNEQDALGQRLAASFTSSYSVVLENALRHQSTPSPLRVLVSDDTRVHTELLADALKRDGHLQVSTSASGSEGLGRADLRDVDVLLLSSTLDEQPGRGFEVLRGLHSAHCFVPAVMLLDSAEREAVLEAFRSGAHGVLGRNESVEIFGKCLQRVHEGQIWANSEQMALLVHAFASFAVSQERDAQLTFEYLLTNHGNVSFQNEATLVECQKAAEQGVLMAQLALAQFYSTNRRNASDVLHSYAWYSIAIERMLQAWDEATKTMTVDQALQAEQMAARWLNKEGKNASGAKSPSRERGNDGSPRDACRGIPYLIR
jgi:DNA-binding NarL/FixJ family response regulator